jgi:hypothetical protein
MRSMVCRCTYGSMAVLMGLACLSAAALADEPTSGPPMLSLSIAGPVRTGEPVQFSGQSAYTSSEQLYLSVFVLPPAAGGCPAQAIVPDGTDPVLIDEPVDNYLTISALSDELNVPGTWTLCGQLSDPQDATVASTNVPFTVTGAAIREAEEMPAQVRTAPASTRSYPSHAGRHVPRHKAGKHHRH